MKYLLDKLKEHLKANEAKYHQVDEWCGSTETGFYDQHNFDIDALMAEIDEFSKQFKDGKL